MLQDLHVSEYVLSNELVSMALAMVAESPAVNVILAELFTVDGNELYIHPAGRYLRYGNPSPSFWAFAQFAQCTDIYTKPDLAVTVCAPVCPCASVCMPLLHVHVHSCEHACVYA